MVSDAAWLSSDLLVEAVAVVHESRGLHTDIGHLTCAAVGPQVAIKVLEHALILQDDISRETLLSTSIAHPGVVRVLASASCRLIQLLRCRAESRQPLMMI